MGFLKSSQAGEAFLHTCATCKPIILISLIAQIDQQGRTNLMGNNWTIGSSLAERYVNRQVISYVFAGIISIGVDIMIPCCSASFGIAYKRNWEMYMCELVVTQPTKLVLWIQVGIVQKWLSTIMLNTGACFTMRATGVHDGWESLVLVVIVNVNNNEE